jgi:tetratricopeptide (TPR) repeat protein
LLGSLTRFWASRGQVREGWDLLNNALAHRPATAGPGLLRGLGAASRLAELHGDWELSGTWSAERVAVARELGDDAEVVLGIAGLGIAKLNSGDTAESVRLFEEGVALARRTEDASCIASAVGNLACVLLTQGAYDRSRALSEEALALARRIADARWVADALDTLAWALLGQGAADEAANFFAEALELTAKSGFTECADFLGGLAAVASRGGRAERAAVLLGAAQGFRSHEGFVSESWYGSQREREVREAARKTLGTETFHRAFAKGLNYSLEDAVNYALGGLSKTS